MVTFGLVNVLEDKSQPKFPCRTLHVSCDWTAAVQPHMQQTVACCDDLPSEPAALAIWAAAARLLAQTTKRLGSWPCTCFFLGSAWMDSDQKQPMRAAVWPLSNLDTPFFWLPKHQRWRQNICLLANTPQGPRWRNGFIIKLFVGYSLLFSSWK